MSQTANVDTERIVFLGTQFPVDIVETLPGRVFPVTAEIRLDRTRAGDEQYDEYGTPDYPVNVRLPNPEPYISRTTVHFDNPAERAPAGELVWHPTDAVEQFQTLFEHLRNETAVNPERVTVEGICVVEIPAQYLTTDSGQHAASPTLYEDEGQMRLAYFNKDASFAATDLRDELDEALPGASRTPLRLTRLDEVTAKPSRHGRGTTTSAGRRQYYTASEADKHNSLEKTPTTYRDRRMSRQGDQTAPLVTVLNNIERFLPALTDTEMLRSVEFSGATRERERFYAHEIIGSDR